MSNFACEHCGAICHDSPNGYITGCEHYPPDLVSVDLMNEDPRYPTLVINGEFGSVGYAVDISTGALSRMCICAAHGDSDCICGAWNFEM